MILATVTRILAAPFAVLAPMDAAVATAAGMRGEATFWLIIALAAVLLVIVATRSIRRHERQIEAERRARMREYREQWFASFERRRLMREARP